VESPTPGTSHVFINFDARAWLIARAGGRAFSIKSQAWRIHETQFIDILELMMANAVVCASRTGRLPKKCRRPHKIYEK